MKVEVFKTNVDQINQAKHILARLRRVIPEVNFHFDLEDCDRVLVCKGGSLNIEKILNLMQEIGVHCVVLEDECEGILDSNFAKFLAEKEF